MVIRGCKAACRWATSGCRNGARVMVSSQRTRQLLRLAWQLSGVWGVKCCRSRAASWQVAYTCGYIHVRQDHTPATSCARQQFIPSTRAMSQAACSGNACMIQPPFIASPWVHCPAHARPHREDSMLHTCRHSHLFHHVHAKHRRRAECTAQHTGLLQLGTAEQLQLWQPEGHTAY